MPRKKSRSRKSISVDENSVADAFNGSSSNSNQSSEDTKKRQQRRPKSSRKSNSNIRHQQRQSQDKLLSAKTLSKHKSRRKAASSSSDNDEESRYQEEEEVEVVRKQLETLSRPLSRVATAFIEEIRSSTATTAPKKSQVTFNNEKEVKKSASKSRSRPHTSHSIKVTEEVPIPSEYREKRSKGKENVALQKKHVKAQKYREEETAESGSEEEEDESSEEEKEEPEDSSSSSNSNADPPIDPTSLKQPVNNPRPTSSKREVISKPVKEEKDDSTSSSFLSTNELHILTLPLNTSIDELKKLFPKARSIKLMLVRDHLQRYRRTAIIQFTNTNQAKQAYKKTNGVRIGGSVIEFQEGIHRATIETNKVLPEEQQSDEEETVDDHLPKEHIDKEMMVREWIQIQSAFTNRK